MNAPENSSIMCKRCLGNFTNSLPIVKLSRNEISKKTSNADIDECSMYEEIPMIIVKPEPVDVKQEINDEPTIVEVNIQDIQYEIPDWEYFESQIAPKVAIAATTSSSLKAVASQSSSPDLPKKRIRKRTYQKKPYFRRKTEEYPKADHYICEFCNREFGGHQRVYFLKHVKSHTRGTHPFECDYCDKRMKAKFQIPLHFAKIHKMNIPTEVTCEECGSGFYNREELRIHYHKVHAVAEGAFKCTEPDCNFAACDRERLRYHTYKVHQRNRFCEICGQMFSSRDIYQHRQKHKLIAKGVEDLTVRCDHPGCGLYFKNNAGLGELKKRACQT